MPQRPDGLPPVGRVELALVTLAGGTRAARGLISRAGANQMRAELLLRATQDVDDAVATAGVRAAASWLTKQLPARSGVAGTLAAPTQRRQIIGDLRRRGLGQRAIANQLGISVRTVAETLASISPAQLPTWIVDTRGRPRPAHNHVPVPVVPVVDELADQAATARELIEAGFSVRAVARTLGVTRYAARQLITESYVDESSE
jgi:predicted transcriptional regulator